MTKAYQAGYNKAAKFKLTGAGSFTVLDVTNQEFSEETTLLEIQNASLGGRPGHINGPSHCSGTITCDFDGLVSPYSTAPGIVSGATGIYQGYINDNAGSPTYFSIPISIEKVNYSIPNNGKVTYNFSWKENALAGTTTFPTA